MIETSGISTAHPVDIHVGKRIRHQRWLQGKTQQQLADSCGIKFQQIQKYETGANRVSASRLKEISDALLTTPMFFFDGLETNEPAQEFDTQQEANLVMLFRKLPEAQRGCVMGVAFHLSETTE